ncbi:unnamed protein product [Paramecium sonneborni]|uniref:Uncharacterized protein n=1 Tax=Paramecium sonneborni TaxID=65129 RepID=A0A8S1RT45_9CILI|nr:unnamed protein product [Paramecium sonneborni]
MLLNIELELVISRVLRQQRGYYNLVGVGDSDNHLPQFELKVRRTIINSTWSSFKWFKKNCGKKQFMKMMHLFGIYNKLISFHFQKHKFYKKVFQKMQITYLIPVKYQNMLTMDDLDIINQGLLAEVRESRINNIYPQVRISQKIKKFFEENIIEVSKFLQNDFLKIYYKTIQKISQKLQIN